MHIIFSRSRMVFNRKHCESRFILHKSIEIPYKGYQELPIFFSSLMRGAGGSLNVSISRVVDYRGLPIFGQSFGRVSNFRGRSSHAYKSHAAAILHHNRRLLALWMAVVKLWYCVWLLLLWDPKGTKQPWSMRIRLIHSRSSGYNKLHSTHKRFWPHFQVDKELMMVVVERGWQSQCTECIDILSWKRATTGFLK